MTKIKIYLILFIASLVTVSCNDDDRILFDSENGRAIAGFVGGEPTSSAPLSITLDPSQEIVNEIVIGVSTTSTSNRSVVVSLNEDLTTLDASFYTLGDLNPVIPAGEFSTSFTVTTNVPDQLPNAADVIVFNLESVEGAEILDTGASQSVETYSITVSCPSVDLASIPGTYTVTASTFAAFFGETDFDREIIQGATDNEFIVVDGVYLTEQSEDLIFTVDPETGSIIAVDETKIASQVSFGPNNYVLQSGSRVLTCAGIVEFNLDFSANIAGNPFDFNLVKQ